MYVMTYHGTFLSLSNDGSLTDVTLAEALQGTPLLELPLEALRGEIATDFLYRSEPTRTMRIDSGPFAGMDLLYDVAARTVAFSRDGAYLSAVRNPGSSRSAFSISRPNVAGWESFLPISNETIAALAHIHAHDWAIRSTHTLVRRDSITLGEGYALRLGDAIFDLRFQPLDAALDQGRSFLMFRDGWKDEKIYLFNPMVFYTSFRSDFVMQQLYLSIDSLMKWGQYTGKIHVLSDRTAEEIESNLSMRPASGVSVQALYPTDFVGYVASKYDIILWNDARAYQPLLYLDPDIMLDRPIEQMLVDILVSEAVCAPIESFSPIGQSPSVGGTLVELDMKNARFAHGANGGTIGFAQLHRHLDLIAQIRHTIANVGHVYGRNFNRWVDQEVLNYVGFSRAGIDKAAISRYVRYGYIPGSEYDVSSRAGLVHFFGRTIEGKVDAMRAYRDALIRDDGRQAVS